MRFTILTLFPEALAPYLNASIIGQAQLDHTITCELINIRDFATDKHHTVDDTPYGGGPGMVMKIEPIHRALQHVQSTSIAPSRHRTVVLAARGAPFTQAKAAVYATLDHLILICGRYEGIDQRVVDHLADEEVSVGPYVLAGGELPALTVLEATARLLPGVLGNPDSLSEESYTTTPDDATPEYPQYTKPADYHDWLIPDVLLSGNHQAIEEWRHAQRTPRPPASIDEAPET